MEVALDAPMLGMPARRANFALRDLHELKRKYDPNNDFRVIQNIQPA
jgi:hypothetical protein